MPDEPFGRFDSAVRYGIEPLRGDGSETDRPYGEEFADGPDTSALEGRHRAGSYLPPEPVAEPAEEIENIAAHYVLGSGTPRRADVLDPAEPLDAATARTGPGFEPEPLFASLASSFPEQVDYSEPVRIDAESTLHFSGPRFEPLTTAPVPEPESPSRAYESPAEIDDHMPSGFEPFADPDRRHTSISAGRHRAGAEPSALGRHRGERTGGIAHSMSGRAVFATAIATALTAGGVGAAATLPADHADSAASQHTVHSIAARTVAESITAKAPASTPAGAPGTRLAINVAAPSKQSAGAARGIKSPTTAGRKAAKAKAKAAKSGKSAKRAKKTKPAKSTPATDAAPAATPAARAATPAAQVEAAAPKWVRPGTGYISSGYEPRWGTFHYGIDLAAPYGSPIYAAGDGVVLRTGPATGFGEAIYLQHANGDTTVYGHEETTLVTPGEHVHAGQLIARVGAEGEATGPHLHFEVHLGSEYGPRTDPGPWLAARGVTL